MYQQITHSFSGKKLQYPYLTLSSRCLSVNI
jgi:hypothetical protein